MFIELYVNTIYLKNYLFSPLRFLFRSIPPTPPPLFLFLGHFVLGACLHAPLSIRHTGFYMFQLVANVLRERTDRHNYLKI